MTAPQMARRDELQVRDVAGPTRSWQPYPGAWPNWSERRQRSPPVPRRNSAPLPRPPPSVPPGSMQRDDYCPSTWWTGNFAAIPSRWCNCWRTVGPTMHCACSGMGTDWACRSSTTSCGEPGRVCRSSCGSEPVTGWREGRGPTYEVAAGQAVAPLGVPASAAEILELEEPYTGLFNRPRASIGCGHGFDGSRDDGTGDDRDAGGAPVRPAVPRARLAAGRPACGGAMERG